MLDSYKTTPNLRTFVWWEFGGSTKLPPKEIQWDFGVFLVLFRLFYIYVAILRLVLFRLLFFTWFGLGYDLCYSIFRFGMGSRISVLHSLRQTVPVWTLLLLFLLLLVFFCFYWGY